MAWYQATATGYYQLGLVVNPADEVPQPMHFPEEPSPSGSPRRYLLKLKTCPFGNNWRTI